MGKANRAHILSTGEGGGGEASDGLGPVLWSDLRSHLLDNFSNKVTKGPEARGYLLSVTVKYN